MRPEPPAWARRALLAIAVLPIVTAVARALAHHWFPIGDNALLYLRTGDVLTEHHPWLGSWTSASLSVGHNMNNPGPIYSDLIAPFAKIFSPGAGAAIGVGAVNIASIIGISVFGRRIGGWTMQLWGLLAAAALSWTMGSEMLIDIWQAHALLLPFLLFLILLVGVTAGHTASIPWALVVLSVLVQTHISFAYILGIMCPVAIAGYVTTRRRRPHLPWRQAVRSRVVLWTAGVMVAVWAQTLYEQLFGPGEGNLTRLATSVGKGKLHVGGGKALGMTAQLFAVPPWWLRGGFATAIPITSLTGAPGHQTLEMPTLPGVAMSALLVLLLVAGLVALVRYHHRRDAHLLAASCMLAIAAVIGSVIAISQLTVGAVGLSSHHVRFLWTLSVFVHMTLAWSLVDRLRRIERVNRVAPWALAGATAAFAVAAVPYCAQPLGPVKSYWAMPALRQVLPHVGELRAVQPVLYDVSNLQIYEPYSSTIMMQMRDLGFEFRVSDEGMIRQLGESRRATGQEKARVFQLQGAAAARYDGDACLIASGSSLSADEAGVAVERADQLAAWVADGSITVDDAVLVGDDASIAPVLEAARGGDLDAASRIVDEGYLSRWYTVGAVTSEQDLSDTFPLVDLYMNTLYSLYSEQSLPCP